MRSKLLGAASGLAALSLVVAGCSSESGDSDGAGDATTLTILDYYNTEPGKGIIQDAVEKCGDQVGATIDREVVPGESLIQTVLQRASSQTMPDVLMLDNPDVKEIAATGALSPLGQYGIDGEGFIQGMIDAATYEGDLYGLAPSANTLGIFYNKTVLEKHGIDPPETWNELKRAAAELTTDQRYGIAFSAIATYEGTWQFLPFMWTNGGDETDLTSPEVAEALQLWVDLVDSGSASASVVNWSQGDVKDQFVAGKAAMMVNGPWQIPAMQDTDFEWDSVPIPVNGPDQKPVAPLGGEIWTVPRTGDQETQKLAAEFVTCMNSPEMQMSLAKQRNVVPTRSDLIDDYVEEVPEMKAFAEQIPDARARTAKVGEEWPEVATDIYNAVQLAITGQASPHEAFVQVTNG